MDSAYAPRSRARVVARVVSHVVACGCARGAHWLIAASALGIGGACSPPSEPPLSVAPEFTAFSFSAAKNPALSTDLVGVVTGDTMRFVTPGIIAVDSLVPSFSTNESASVVTVGSAVQQSGTTVANFTADLRYTVRSSTGQVRTYVVVVTVFTGLPAVHIDTDGGIAITSRVVYIPATVRVYGGKDHPEWSFAATTNVRGRGNSTWDNPKKPYRLKLTTAASMFGFPADRDWTLLANYWDISLARNATAFKISEVLGMAFTPRCTPIEMFVNGAHQGAYELCDHIEVAPNRVPAGTDGWFLELVDERRATSDGDSFFHTPQIDEYSTRYDPSPSVWSYKQPAPPTVAQRTVVEGQLLAFERLLYGAGFADPDTGYAAQVDVRSLIDWYLVNELSKNNDSAFSLSVLIYRTASGRITFGPVWDFDLAFGNYPYDGVPEGWKIKTSGWMERFFADPAFVAQVKARWAVLNGKRAAIDTFLRDYAERLTLSQRLSHALWSPYLPLPLLVASEPAEAFSTPVRQPFAMIFTDADYATEVQRTRAWLSTRWDWLDAQIAGL